jgi:hypothetical protein
MIQKYLDKHGIQYAKKEMVHPSTLKSLMRELIESGKNFPMDIFRAITGKRAKLTNN